MVTFEISPDISLPIPTPEHVGVIPESLFIMIFELGRAHCLSLLTSVLSILPSCFYISDKHESMPTSLLESMPLCLWQEQFGTSLSITGKMTRNYQR
ncbi:unnamed protein product, partial [Vitis vinifera]